VADFTKFRGKMTATHLVPEQLDGYDYQYQIAQEHRNTKGLLDTNPVFQGQVVSVKEIVGGEYPYIVFAKVSLLDEGIPDKQNFTDYENSQELTLMDKFLPETKDTIAPVVGQIVYLSYSDSNNRLGGIYIAPVKTFDFADTIMNAAAGIVEGTKNLFNPSSGKKVSTNGSNGNCNTTYSNCASTPKGTGEYEIKFGDIQSSGFVKMVVLDFNPKNNILVQEKAYKSLQKMFQDAKSEGLNLRINNGFRSYETQECFYRSYQACIEEWKKAGANPNDKPSPAGNPKRTKNTSSSHMNGMAADFNTGTNRKQQNMLDIFSMAKTKSASVALEETKKRLDLGKISTTKEWTWLVNNSEKYGWVWSGIKFREPWHFHFDENLAKRSNMV
jgi:LAS superfamily LD-carboxypeptidase LdcB